MEKHLKKIKAEREKRYGSHLKGHKNLGLIWTGLLQNHYEIELPHPLPGFLVEAMMAANKLNRIATDSSHKDSYDDAKIYISLAQDSAKHKGGK